jgi:hypothetical protein
MGRLIPAGNRDGAAACCLSLGGNPHARALAGVNGKAITA